MSDWLDWRRRRRERHLVDALPEALDRLAADLRGGGSVLDGLRNWTGVPGPLASDIAEMLHRVEQGSGLVEALHEWQRGHSPPVGVVAGALQVAFTVGGRCAAALEGLAEALRDSSDARAEARAQSSQARLSAFVVGVAPLASIGLSSLSDRRVVAALVATGPGLLCLAGGLTLELVAALWMRRIVRLAG